MKLSKTEKRRVSIWKTLQPMSWSERFGYMLSYYAEIAFVLFIAGLIVTVLLLSAFRDRSEVIFGGAFANTDVNKAGYEYLTTGVLSLFDGDSKTQKVELSSTAFPQTPDYSMIGNAHDAAMKPVAQMEEGIIDYIVMNESAMMFYMTQYILGDLRLVFSEEELSAMGERVIFLELEKEGTRCPVAIRVDQLPFFRDCVDVSEPIFFSFTENEKKAGTHRFFWEYLMNWDSDIG